MIQGVKKSNNEYVYSEEGAAIRERSIRGTRYKLIVNLWTAKEQLFYLKNDPGELSNIADENPSILREMDAQLRTRLKENEPSRQNQCRRWRIYT